MSDKLPGDIIPRKLFCHILLNFAASCVKLTIIIFHNLVILR